MELKSFLERSADRSLIDCLDRAIVNSQENEQPTTLAHVLDSLLEDKTVHERLDRSVLLDARGALKAVVGEVPKSPKPGSFGFDISNLTQRAMENARDVGAPRVGPLVFLATALSEGLLRDDLSRRVLEAVRVAGLRTERLLPARTMNVAGDWTFAGLGFGTDLSAMARAGAWSESPVVGMERELQNLVISISSGWESVAIIGDAGVGKSSLVNGLAYYLWRGAAWVPPELTDYSIVQISRMDLIAGTTARGAMEERLKRMIRFLRANKRVVPFFDEFHALLNTEDPTSREIAAELKPAMGAGQIRCIGATTDQEYARFIASDPAVDRRFSTKILVPEPDSEATVRILHGVLRTQIPEELKAQHFTVAEPELKRVVELTDRFQRGLRQPGKSIQLLKRALVLVNYESKLKPREDNYLAKADVARAFSSISKIPENEIADDRRDFYSKLAHSLERSIVGQDHVVAKICGTLEMRSLGWIDPQRPQGRFLFLGPPGVGKTALALRLAEEIMKDGGSLVVKNMNGFKGEGARTKFMGAPPGYVGYRETTTIYNRVLMRPYSIIVLDEIEKADGSLSDVLLSVLDGSSEDGQGQVVDFSNCIFVLTSNEISNDVTTDTAEAEVRKRLLDSGGIFQPAFLDRIDEVVVFRRLDRSTLLSVLDLVIASRKAKATRPLPTKLQQLSSRESIVDEAIRRSGGFSARSLEGALRDFLKQEFKRGDKENASLAIS